MAAIISSTEAALLADSNKTIKLRSSCDTCNEAKVRCSQSKPHCQRCLRLGTTCVYGLSRRSHKTAPRIGASQTSALAYLYTNSQSTNSDGSDDIDQFRDDLQWLTGQSTPDMNIDAWSYALDSLSNSSDALFSLNDASRGAYLSKFGQLPRGTDDASKLLSPDLEMLDPQLIDLWQAGNLTPTVGSSDGRSGNTSTAVSDSGKAMVPLSRDCTCAARSAQAAAQASASLPDNQSFDARLSRLKLNIKTLQETLSCPCVYEDQATILSTCVALGRVLHEFQDTLANFSSLTSPPPNRSPSDASDSSVQAPPREGRLSIGTVPVEPEEEQELKLHLWLLQLRKLETILGVMDMTIQKMKNMHGNDFTHIVACESIYSWLTQTAKATRDKFHSQRGHRHA